mmetsp:Transcript_63313/g.166030  ORF Transcript_63313/g.166030 Transcript_63313/m.166030 type:complete len:214 (+) Transcript_63313:1533-2174(+)
MLSSSLAFACWDCTRAMSFRLSALASDAASTTADREFTKLFVLEVSICAKDAGFFFISRWRTPMARVTASMDSMSSDSLEAKSLNSLSRTSVAALSSPSSADTLPASSSIFAEDASTSPAALPMVASSLALLSWAVFSSYFEFFAASSHHSTKSWYAFASASPCFVIFAAKESIKLKTCPRGFVLAAGATAPRTTKARSGMALESCIALKKLG